MFFWAYFRDCLGISHTGKLNVEKTVNLRDKTHTWTQLEGYFPGSWGSSCSTQVTGLRHAQLPIPSYTQKHTLCSNPQQAGPRSTPVAKKMGSAADTCAEKRKSKPSQLPLILLPLPSAAAAFIVLNPFCKPFMVSLEPTMVFLIVVMTVDYTRIMALVCWKAAVYRWKCWVCTFVRNGHKSLLFYLCFLLSTECVVVMSSLSF